MRRTLLVVFLVLCCQPVALAAPPPAPFACGLPAGGWLSEGPTDRTAHAPSVGTVQATLLLVDFPEHPATEDPATAIATYVKGAQRWWDEESYGKLRVVFNAPPKWFRMPASAASYAIHRGLDFDTHRRYLAAAVATADPSVDFSSTQLLYVASPAASGIDESPAFIALRGTGITADGVELRHGANLGDDSRTHPAVPQWATGILVHETGHAMGLPDLYDVRSAVDIHRAVGPWDPMGFAFSAGDLLAWHKWKLGWLDDTQVTCLRSGRQQLTLTPLEAKGGSKAVVVPTGRTTAIVAEVRTRTGRDALLCDEGVLVYTVDTSRATGAFPVQVRSAQPALDRVGGLWCPHLAHAPFDVGRGENPTFTDKASRTTIQVVRKDGGSRTVVVTKG